MKKALVVVDMQKDFIYGSLGSPGAESIIQPIEELVQTFTLAGDTVIFTMDTHDESYLHTREGQGIPIPHCLKGTDGWKLVDPLASYVKGSIVLEKNGFGAMKVIEATADCEEITVVGICTDICVITNALLLRAAHREADIRVLRHCCWGISRESHEAALLQMERCLITVV